MQVFNSFQEVYNTHSGGISTVGGILCNRAEIGDVSVDITVDDSNPIPYLAVEITMGGETYDGFIDDDGQTKILDPSFPFEKEIDTYFDKLQLDAMYGGRVQDAERIIGKMLSELHNGDKTSV